MKQTHVSWNDVQGYVQEILRQIQKDLWRPDYIVGLTRGGLTPAVLISQYLDCVMHTLNVSLRDGSDLGPESNLWMAEDAYGHPDSEIMGDVRKNILIVDDINDSGATLNWIKEDWRKGCFPNDTIWDQGVWGHNVRVAVLYDNESSDCEVPISYSAVSINKAADPQWMVFPWEAWWKR